MSDTEQDNLPNGWVITTLGEVTGVPINQGGPEGDFVYVDISCKFRRKTRSDSVSKCAAIPLENAHLFRAKVRRDSNRKRAPSDVRQSIGPCAIPSGEGGREAPFARRAHAQKETVHANHPRSSATEMAVRSVQS